MRREQPMMKRFLLEFMFTCCRFDKPIATIMPAVSGKGERENMRNAKLRSLEEVNYAFFSICVS